MAIWNLTAELDSPSLGARGAVLHLAGCVADVIPRAADCSSEPQALTWPTSQTTRVKTVHLLRLALPQMNLLLREDGEACGFHQ